MQVKGLNHRIFIGLCGALHVGASRSLGQSTRPQHQCVPLPQRFRNETADSDGRTAPCGLGPFAGGVENQASGPMVASHDSWRDPWVAVGALAVGDARAQYTAGLDPPQTASITSRAKVPRPLVSLHLRVQPARPGPPHTTSRPVAPPCAASTGSPPYTNRLGPRRRDAARLPRRRRQRSNARAETIVAVPTAPGRELRYVRRGSAADDWLEHRALLPGSVCTRARVPHGAFFGCSPKIHVRAVTFRRSGPPARRGGRARAGLHLVRYSAKIGGFYNTN